MISRREFGRAGAAALGLALTPALARTASSSSFASPELHFLRRVGWGVRAGDMATLTRVGWPAYLETQLEPGTLPDPALDAFTAENQVLLADWPALQRAADDDYGSLLERALWARLYRAAWSERGLFERIVEMWTDHFNIPIPDLLPDKIVDDREVIRKHALGRFGDLLLASAMSPAMLKYLDNASSSREYPNENYARELLELHTLSVDGGYTERDVKEVARALTGWSLHDGFPGRFYFDAGKHDDGEKVVLGRTLPAGRGIEDGLEVLDLLAHHPATARFIALKLGRIFVQDEPPERFIKSTAEVFTQTGGELKAVVRHVFHTPEFWASAGKKYRRPLEQLVASLRALGPTLTVSPKGRGHFIWLLETLGHKPYHWFPPNGYPQTTDAWLAAGSLLERWNLAMTLPYASEGWLEGVTLDLSKVVPKGETVGAWVQESAVNLTGTPLADAQLAALVTFVADTPDPDYPLTEELYRDKRAALAGLLLASPGFSWG